MTQELSIRAKQFLNAYPNLPKSLVLVGHMGSGKSTIGRKLGQILNLPFLDADVEIEASAGQSIPDIFAQHGEAYFRDGEVRVIRRILDGPPVVLATGGGAFMNAKTRAHIGQKGVSIWLKADMDTLIARTRGRNHRPLLQREPPRRVFRRLFQQRDPVYSQADIVVKTGKEPPEAAVLRVLDGLDAFLTSSNRDQATPDHSTPAQSKSA